MIDRADMFTEWILKLLDNFERLVTNKPFISVVFPSSGFGSLFIPTNISTIVDTSNPILDFISNSTPYLKFLFLLLTILLTVVSFILQVRKVVNKNKDNE